MMLKRKKISIRECLADPKERRQMLCGAVRFIQAVEGRDISMEQAEEAYDKMSCSKERWKMDRAAIRNLLRRLAIELMDNDEDISETSYTYLRELLEAFDSRDIIDSVDATDGRFYIKEDASNILRDAPHGREKE